MKKLQGWQEAARHEKEKREGAKNKTLKFCCQRVGGEGINHNRDFRPNLVTIHRNICFSICTKLDNLHKQ